MSILSGQNLDPYESESRIFMQHSGWSVEVVRGEGKDSPDQSFCWLWRRNNTAPQFLPLFLRVAESFPLLDLNHPHIRKSQICRVEK